MKTLGYALLQILFFLLGLSTVWFFGGEFQ